MKFWFQSFNHDASSVYKIAVLWKKMDTNVTQYVNGTFRNVTPGKPTSLSDILTYCVERILFKACLNVTTFELNITFKV